MKSNPRRFPPGFLLDPNTEGFFRSPAYPYILYVGLRQETAAVVLPELMLLQQVDVKGSFGAHCPVVDVRLYASGCLADCWSNLQR